MGFLELYKGLNWSNSLTKELDDWKEYKEYRNEIEKTAGEIQVLARNNKMNVDREIVGYILYAIELALYSSLEETRKINEFARLSLALNTGKQIKFGKTECCCFKEDLKTIICDYLAKWFQEDLHPVRKMLLDFDVGKVLGGDVFELKRLVEKVDDELRYQELNDKYKCKVLARRICEILHPDYMKDKRLLPKNEVCFIYDILVYANLRDDEGKTAPDDKYDAIKRFFKKEQVDGGGYSFSD